MKRNVKRYAVVTALRLVFRRRGSCVEFVKIASSLASIALFSSNFQTIFPA